MARTISVIFCLLVLLSLAACSGNGPSAFSVSTNDIKEASVTVPDGAYTGDYFLFEIDERVARLAGRRRPMVFASTFGLGGERPRQTVGVGDQLSIRIWEAGTDGLFTGQGGQAPQIDVVVDHDGRIFIPFVGRVRVAGKSIEAVRQTLQQSLEGNAVEPQVQVVVVTPLSHAIVIVGDVNRPGQYPISPAGTDVLDIVADAGGSRGPTYETTIRLKRNDTHASALLEDVFNEPRNNVPLRPNDNLLIVTHPRTYTALGAVGANQVVIFGAPRVTLAEALAKVGGLQDNKANAEGIFLFRFEDPDLVQTMDPSFNLTGYSQIPVVYQLSLKSVDGFFYARDFQMRDKDILYVANSLTADAAKFLAILQPFFSTTLTIRSLSN